MSISIHAHEAFPKSKLTHPLVIQVDKNNDPVPVHSMRMKIDDVEYQWDNDRPFPAKREDTITDLNVFRHKIGFSPGDTLPFCRLDQMPIFYSSEVSLHPSGEKGSYDVLIDAKGNLLWFPGFGECFLGVTRYNISGPDKTVEGIAGLNCIGGAYTDNHSFNLPLVFSGDLYYSDSGFGLYLDPFVLLSYSRPGKPAFKINLEGNLSYSVLSNYFSWGVSLAPQFFFSRFHQIYLKLGYGRGGLRDVRSGWPESQFDTASHLLASIEYFFPIYPLLINGWFDLYFGGFIFFDVGVAKPFFQDEILDAYGVGLSLTLDFRYIQTFRAGVGITRNLEPRFVYSFDAKF